MGRREDEAWEKGEEVGGEKTEQKIRKQPELLGPEKETSIMMQGFDF